jgi:hypothetical protein
LLVAVAQIGVVARGAIDRGRVSTSIHRIARVGRARIVVVAVGRRPWLASALLAQFAAVAQIAIVARGAVALAGVLTTLHGVALVVGARVVVVAERVGGRVRATAVGGIADVLGAIDAVAAPGVVRGVDAAQMRVADVIGARDVVVAERVGGNVLAARRRIADVGGARDAVVAICVGLADSVDESCIVAQRAAVGLQNRLNLAATGESHQNDAERRQRRNQRQQFILHRTPLFSAAFGPFRLPSPEAKHEFRR